VRQNILSFYSDLNAPYATKRDPKAWAKVQVELDQLKSAPPVGPLMTGPADSKD
jgi:hypothetical protein